MRVLLPTIVSACALGVLSGCGGDPAEPLISLPESGTAYRALSQQQRLAVAERCREDAASMARAPAASQLADIDLKALRAQLDAAFRITREQRRTVGEVCAEQLPFETPGLRLGFDGAEGSGDTFTYETDSDIPLRISGTVAPAPREGTVVARRESGGSRSVRGRIGAGGRFALPAIRLRKIADNTFIVTINAPPNAARKAYFSAICLDCLAAGSPPDAAR